MANFSDRLRDGIVRTAAPVVVGLDPRFESLPEALLRDHRDTQDPKVKAGLYLVFCRQVIDAVCQHVPAVKPQSAFFEELGPAGMIVLAEVIQYARQKGLLVILDAKRNDIGSTATAYAKGMLGANSPWQADCLTISPYLGDDSLTPFVETATANDAGLFCLVKTSNPGGKMLQDLVVDGQPIYRHVGAYVEGLAKQTIGECGLGAVGAVVGATYPDQLTELREAMPSTWFLVPGYGSQGGGAKDVAGGFNEAGLGAIVNNSRGIIFAYSREPYASKYEPTQWQRAVEDATLEMIADLQAETTAGKLKA